MKFSENIKNFRLKAKLTQEQLANKVGVSPQAVSKWESGNTYPDVSLLVPIANTLGVSLDCLFGNDKIYDGDTARRLFESLDHTGRDKRMEKVLNFCRHIEKALFGDDNREWDLDGQKRSGTSYIDTDRGFTYLSNSAPFFAVFPESENGRKIDEDKVRAVFEILGDRDVISAVLFLLKEEWNYTFEKEVLAARCGISLDNIAGVMAKLERLLIVTGKDVNINSKVHRLYFYSPRCEIMMLLIAAGEIGYSGGYFNQACMRSKSYLK